jgi:phosphopantothenoylcysteine decarboxylase/phosphopantothenate--cysteine ligase
MKKILITAGPTWVRLDDVRVITNVFTGKTGVALAEHLAKKGHRVTLLLGPGGAVPKKVKGLTVIPFVYFEELRALLKAEIAKGYDAFIPTAAVADYLPVSRVKGKIASGQDDLSIRFKRAPKLIKEVRKADKNIRVIQFKLESNITRDALFDAAKRSMTRNTSDYCVANLLQELPVRYILDAKGDCVAACPTPAYLFAAIERIVSLS